MQKNKNFKEKTKFQNFFNKLKAVPNSPETMEIIKHKALLSISELKKPNDKKKQGLKRDLKQDTELA